MRVFKTKVFRRFQKSERLNDAALCEAVARAEQGLIDAALARCLIKQRVARDGGGRRGGFRTIIAYRKADRAVFIFGFAKSSRENISAADERDLADTGAMLLGLNDRDLEILIDGEELWELDCNDKT